MIKPTYIGLVFPKIDISEPIIDTEPDRKPERYFGITIKHLEFSVRAKNAEHARQRLEAYLKKLQSRAGIHSGVFCLVIHEGDHEELNEGIC